MLVVQWLVGENGVGVGDTKKQTESRLERKDVDDCILVDEKNMK